MDRSPGGRRSRQAAAGAACGQGNHSAVTPPRRPQAVAGNCVKKDRKVCAVRMMKVGPSEPLCKKRLQTAVSGLCRKTMVVNVTVKRRGLITSGVNERGECE